MAAGKKKHSLLVWIMMGFIMLGLGGYGVSEFSSMGLSGVATVGKTRVSSGEYVRTLRNEINGVAAQIGRHVPMAEAREMGLVLQARQRLLSAATIEEEARVLGISVGDATVARTLLSIDAFSGLTGQFDRNRYGETLRREGLNESEFEHDLRVGEARGILLDAVMDGIEAPRPVVDRTTAWILQRRDISWQELTAADLPDPVELPDEAALRAWHEATAEHFTAPEIRHFTVAWLAPDMLIDSVMIDEQALRDIYEDSIGDYQQPERRLLGRLVYPTVEAAQAARAQADAGASFEELANARGLSLDDTDLGEVTEAQLGIAGAAVFAAADTGIIGPLESDLGPALFAVHAILDPLDIPFEEAQEALRIEAAEDQARRNIEARSEDIIDLVAGGAEIEDLAEAADMQVDSIDWRPGDQAAPGTIAAYPAFREAARIAASGDFPELRDLEDGGIFALRLDSVTPPEVIPFEEARAAVEADWLAAETRRRLLALADARREARIMEQAAAAAPPAGPVGDGATGAAGDTAGDDAAAGDDATATADRAADGPAEPPVHVVDGMTRDGFIDGAPLAVVSQAFEMQAEGDVEVVDAENRVILVTLRAIHSVDPADEAHADTRASVATRLQQSLAGDVADAWLNAAMQAHGIRIDSDAMARAENMVQ